MHGATRRDVEVITTTSTGKRKENKPGRGTTPWACAVLAVFVGLIVCASTSVSAVARSTVQPGQGPTHTVWQGGEATVTGAIAHGTRLRVHAVLNKACQVGDVADATCRPQSLLGWETITEDGTFSPVPAPVAPYGVCEGDTAVIANGHTLVISRQLFACFTLNVAADLP